MWNVTIRGVRARKVRLLLTALAVVLGVSFVTGVFVFTDTLRASFDRVFRETAADVDLVVRSADAPGGSLQRERIPDSILRDVRSTPGVAAADGIVQGISKFVDRDGETIQNEFAPTLGISWPTVEGVGPLHLVDDGESRPPRRAGEVAIDAHTAAEHGYEVGDEVGVQVHSRPVRSYRIVGRFDFGDVTDLGGVTFAAFDFEVAQQAFDADDTIDFVNVRREPAVSTDALQRDLAAQLGPGIEVIDAGLAAEELADPVRDALNLLRQLLLAFGAVGVFVGAFIIVNTFSVLISQRTRELGLLRALGASRGQLVVAVLVEALILGAIASGVGILGGLALARLLLALFGEFGFDVPDAPTVLGARTIVLALVVGVGVTVVSAIFPALRAARTPPVVAVAHEMRSTSSPSLLRRTVVGGALLVVGVLMVGVGLEGEFADVRGAIATVAAGCFTGFVGIVLVVPLMTRALVRVLATGATGLVVTVAGAALVVGALLLALRAADEERWAATAAGIAVAAAGVLLMTSLPALRGAIGMLARGNAARNPRRTTATASALVLGVTLVFLVTIVASSIRLSLQSGIEDGVQADIVLSAERFAPISPRAVRDVEELPDVRAVAALRFGSVGVSGRSELLAGVNPSGFAEVVTPDVVAGEIADLPDGLFVSSAEAERLDLELGDTVPVTFSQLGPAFLPVTGIFDNRAFTGSVLVDFLVSNDTFESGFGPSQPVTVAFVRAEPDASAGLQREIQDLLGTSFPDTRVQTVAEFQAEQDDAIDLIVNVLFGLLVFSLVIAVLGIVNTLFLSVHERTRELGLLRVVGMTPVQMRRMVRGEAIVIALMGCLFGLVAGLAWGWAFTQALFDEGVTRLSMPPVPLAVFVALGATAGVIAAAGPAWRAGRLDVLEAIAEE